MYLAGGEYAEVLEFEPDQLFAGARVGDTVRVTFFPQTIDEGMSLKNYSLESQDMTTKKFTARLIDYVEIAKTRISKQVYF